MVTKGTRTSASASRPAAQRRPAFRQVAATGTSGSFKLGYPFNPQATPTRSPARQAMVEEFAQSCLNGGIYKHLSASGCKWFPSDYDEIRREAKPRWGAKAEDELCNFLASVYICDLAHAALGKVKKEIKNLSILGSDDSTVTKNKIYGILANLTGIDLTSEAIQKKLRRTPGTMKAVDALANNGDNGDFPALDLRQLGNVPPPLMYPFSYGASVPDAIRTPPSYRVRNKIRLAVDVWVHELYNIIKDGKYNTADFSLTSRAHVFLPLGIEGGDGRYDPTHNDMNTNSANSSSMSLTLAAQDAIQLDELVAKDTYQGISRPVSLNLTIMLQNRYSRGTNATLALSRGTYNNMTIREYETQLINDEIGVLVRQALDILDKFDVYDSKVYDINRVPTSYPSDPCPDGQTPKFLTGLGDDTDYYRTPDGRISAPGAAEMVCVSGTKVMSRQRLAGGMLPTAAGQRRASSAKATLSAKNVTLKQVEALPKKELAKFVQRIVNM